MERELTCIVCPRGCTLHVTLEEGKVVALHGATCKRGETYAHSECTNPVRTLTTTVALEGGGVLPVKTNRPIPKELLFACMEAVNQVKAPRNCKAGDVIIANILGTGADLVSVKTVSDGE